jgi:hypothetical protein
MKDGYKRLQLLTWLVGGPLLVGAVIVQLGRIANGGQLTRDFTIALVAAVLTVVAIAIYVWSLVGAAITLKRRLGKKFPDSLVFVSRRQHEFHTVMREIGASRLSAAHALPTYFVVCASPSGIEFWAPRSPLRAVGRFAWPAIEGVRASTMLLYYVFEVPCMALEFETSSSKATVALIPSRHGVGINPAYGDEIGELVQSINALRHVGSAAKSP